MTNKISMIELFSGVGAQERALRQLGLPYEIINTCDCDANAVLSYAAMRYDLEKEMETFKFPLQDEMIKELQAKNLGYDFQKGKHTITNRTPLTKLKQYYIADKLSKNLGDISKVERLPYSDFVTYSYPCTDLSVAGKGEGMVNKCDKCNHTWPIDFETPQTNNVCPNCGNIDIKSTRSGLLGQVQRLLTVSYEEGTLPKYLLLENVKNLTGKKFKPQFDAWINWLDLIGYNTYYQVLNGKKYGIPQNRERVFAISIRKDVDTTGFTFPEAIPLTTRLKDVLEKSVDEKYYLPDDRIEKILNSSFMQEKKRIQMTDVCDTLLARDWKDPKCVPVEGDINPIRIGGLYDDESRHKQAGSIFDKDAISPALTTMEGGHRQPLVIDEIKVVGNYMPSNHDASRVVDIDGIAPTVKENHGTVTAIAEPQVLRAERTEYGKTIRKQYEAGEIDEKIGNMREMKPRTDGVANTVTTVLKDNYVIEPKEEKHLWTETQKQMITEDGNVKRYINSDVVDEFNVGDCADISFPNGYNKANRVFDGYAPAINGTTTQSSFIVKEPIIYDDYNSRISADQDAINTLTCNCGASAERNGVKIIEQVAIVEDQFPGSRDARIYPEYSPTLRQNCGGLEVAKGEVEEKIKWRIRKLMPIECWKLMAFSRSDHNKAAKFVSNSALYKQAGNSIIVNCLTALMCSLFIEDGYKAEVWTKYVPNLED